MIKCAINLVIEQLFRSDIIGKVAREIVDDAWINVKQLAGMLEYVNYDYC